MNKPGSIAGQLSELGYRLTPQRAMILSAIEDSDNHISTEEIYVQIAAEHPQVNISTVFAEITTLGVRIHHLERKKLSREILSIKTRFGEIKVKIGKTGNQIKNITPEYESCKEIVVKQGIPLKDVYDEAKEAARKALFQGKRTI